MPAVGDAVELHALQREYRALKTRVAEPERLVVCDTLISLFNRLLERWSVLQKRLAH